MTNEERFEVFWESWCEYNASDMLDDYPESTKALAAEAWDSAVAPFLEDDD